jgi:hypothetical protein
MFSLKGLKDVKQETYERPLEHNQLFDHQIKKLQENFAAHTVLDAVDLYYQQPTYKGLISDFAVGFSCTGELTGYELKANVYCVGLYNCRGSYY